MKTNSNNRKEWLIYGSLGLLVSLCAILVMRRRSVLQRGLLHRSAYRNDQSLAIHPIPLKHPHQPLPPTPPPAGPTLDAPLIIGQAYDLMLNNDIQGAIDLLEGNLAGINEHTQKTLATQTLGDLYSMKGDFQFAAVYYEQLYELEPNAFGLMLIAHAYDAGGNLEKAQEYYLKCLETYDPFFTEDDCGILEDAGMRKPGSCTSGPSSTGLQRAGAMNARKGERPSRTSATASCHLSSRWWRIMGTAMNASCWSPMEGCSCWGCRMS